MYGVSVPARNYYQIEFMEGMAQYIALIALSIIVKKLARHILQFFSIATGMLRWHHFQISTSMLDATRLPRTSSHLVAGQTLVLACCSIVEGSLS